MTTVAGIGGIVAVHMTGAALGIVVTVEAKVVTVIESRRQPGLAGMAFTTVGVDLLVQGVARLAVAAVALFPRRDLQQVVGEATDRAERFHALVLAVAGDTVLLGQLLVKGYLLVLVVNRHPGGFELSDLLHPVAGDALVGGAADERRVAGETVIGQIGMGLDRPPG